MPHIRLLFAVAVLTATGTGWQACRAEVYELRTYTTNSGKLEALNARFRDHTVALFRKHGMESIGYWVPDSGPESRNTLIYVIRHESRDAAQENWKSFLADPEWKRVAEESRKDGRILAKRPESTYMVRTDYSPEWKGEDDAGDSSEAVFELRIYKAAPGKLDALDARFRDHTIALFQKHGMRSVAYWHAMDEPDADDTLIYIIRHNSREAAKTSWPAFAQDPAWQKAARESGVGKLAQPPKSVYMKATDYSEVQ